jgi:N-acylneuraminate cytidylyltransferase
MFLGQPTIVRAIRTAQDASVFESVFVSTDDQIAASLALEHGAVVPSLRPAWLADDSTPTRPVIVHALHEWLDSTFDIIACLYPVTPLLEPDLLARAVGLAEVVDGYVFPVERSRHPVQRAVVLDGDGRSRSREPEAYFQRSQDLEPVFFDVGQFYVARREVWEAVESFHDRGSIIEVEPGSVIDVDTQEDWVLAEQLYRSREESGHRGD